MNAETIIKAASELPPMERARLCHQLNTSSKFYIAHYFVDPSSGTITGVTVGPTEYTLISGGAEAFQSDNYGAHEGGAILVEADSPELALSKAHEELGYDEEK